MTDSITLRDGDIKDIHQQMGEDYVPDSLFETDNDWEIPKLRDDMQAQVCDIPFVRYGEQARTFHPRNIVEPNYSLFNETPAAFGLREIYKKRFIARSMQEKGIRIFVDLNVAQKWIKLNLLGVPSGWRAYATRGYSDRLQALELEYRIAEANAGLKGNKPLFVCYGGGQKCKAFCQEVGAVYVTPIISTKTKERAWEQLKKDDCILFMDGDFSLKAIEEKQKQLWLEQVVDYNTNNLITE